VALRRCRVAWGKNVPAYFSHALEAEDVSGLTYEGFDGTAAHPEHQRDVLIR
jgi:hypothetical protein